MRNAAVVEVALRSGGTAHPLPIHIPLPFPSPPPSSACILPGGALPYTPAGLISQQSLVLNIFIHQEIR